MSLDLYLSIETEVFDGNCTHNLTPMWHRAGVYEALYNSRAKQAKEIIDILTKGLSDMRKCPEDYIMLNPANGWGDYEGAVQFLERFLKACVKHPDAIIGLSR